MSEELDCGDNSCRYAPRMGGMRTNGGCRCLKDLSAEQRRKVERYSYKQSLELQSLKQQLSRIMQVAGERAERIKELEDIIYTPPHV